MVDQIPTNRDTLRVAADERNNRIIGRPKMVDSTVQFIGNNNILYFESEGILLENSSIVFKGENSVVVIRKSATPLRLCIVIYNDSAVHIGKNVWTTNRLELNAGEAKHIIIGNDVLLGSQCMVRTTDSHMLYSIESMSRINKGKSVFIGDHVWLAARVVLLKGARLYSGCIVGCDSVIAGKEISSNTVWAGNPARLVKSDVFFDKEGTHGLRAEQQEKDSAAYDDVRNYIFEGEEGAKNFQFLDKKLTEAENADARLNFLLEMTDLKDKNRFAKRTDIS